jgi:hypothetical protein
MSPHQQNRLQRLIGSVVLLGFLWIGTGSAHLFPFFFLSIDHRHALFLIEEHDQVHLVLHHPGHPDAHEASTPVKETHSHERSAPLSGILSTGQENVSDHALHLSRPLPQMTPSAKAGEPLKLFSFLMPTRIEPTWIEPDLSEIRFLSPPLQSRPVLASLRTTVLLI